MKYEELERMSHEEVESALSDGTAEQAARALLSVALHDGDRLWVEGKCLGALQDPRGEVRAAAITALGHVARIHRAVPSDAVIPQLMRLKNDPQLGGLVEDTLEDILMFTSSTSA
jgi:hypothetical protein